MTNIPLGQVQAGISLHYAIASAMLLHKTLSRVFEAESVSFVFNDKTARVTKDSNPDEVWREVMNA